MAGKSGGILLDKLTKFDKKFQKAIRNIFIDLGLEKRDDKIDGPDPNRFTGFDDYLNKKSKGGQIKVGVQMKGTSPLIKKRKGKK